jgi:hypothetical protein
MTKDAFNSEEFEKFLKTGKLDPFIEKAMKNSVKNLMGLLLPKSSQPPYGIPPLAATLDTFKMMNEFTAANTFAPGFKKFNCSFSSILEAKKQLDMQLETIEIKYQVAWADRPERLAKLLWLAGKCFERNIESFGILHRLGIYRGK